MPLEVELPSVKTADLWSHPAKEKWVSFCIGYVAATDITV